MQTVVLALQTHHFEEVYVGRGCTYEAINDRLTCQFIVYK